jgi:hypothetical protein
MVTTQQVDLVVKNALQRTIQMHSLKQLCPLNIKKGNQNNKMEHGIQMHSLKQLCPLNIKGQPKQQNGAWEGWRLQFHDLTNLKPGRRQNRQKGTMMYFIELISAHIQKKETTKERRRDYDRDQR